MIKMVAALTTVGSVVVGVMVQHSLIIILVFLASAIFKSYFWYGFIR